MATTAMHRSPLEALTIESCGGSLSRRLDNMAKVSARTLRANLREMAELARALDAFHDELLDTLHDAAHDDNERRDGMDRWADQQEAARALDEARYEAAENCREFIAASMAG